MPLMEESEFEEKLRIEVEKRLLIGLNPQDIQLDPWGNGLPSQLSGEDVLYLMRMRNSLIIAAYEREKAAAAPSTLVQLTQGDES